MKLERLVCNVIEWTDRAYKINKEAYEALYTILLRHPSVDLTDISLVIHNATNNAIFNRALDCKTLDKIGDE